MALTPGKGLIVGLGLVVGEFVEAGTALGVGTVVVGLGEAMLVPSGCTDGELLACGIALDVELLACGIALDVEFTNGAVVDVTVGLELAVSDSAVASLYQSGVVVASVQ
jgi:hypothetical protein